MTIMTFKAIRSCKREYFDSYGVYKGKIQTEYEVLLYLTYMYIKFGGIFIRIIKLRMIVIPLLYEIPKLILKIDLSFFESITKGRKPLSRIKKGLMSKSQK